MDYIYTVFAMFHILFYKYTILIVVLFHIVVHNFVTCEIVLLLRLGILLVVCAKFVLCNKRGVCITLLMIVIIYPTVY